MSYAVHAPQSVEVMIWRPETDSNEIKWSFAFTPGEILLVSSGYLEGCRDHLMDDPTGVAVNLG